ncbi:MAG TPA: glycosyl hydrolase [Solirubrobacterales bacterium]|nr:glycosyl hydrolase [Solirubrobacterales bacterium]
MRTVRPLLLAAATLAALLFPPGAVAAGADGRPPIVTGAYIREASDRPEMIDRYAERVGRFPVIVMSYKDWGTIPFSSEQLDAIWNRGGVPMITWEPWTAEEEGIALRHIAAKRWDRYLRRAARSASNWGKPLMVRFAHEMNGDWFPWGRGVNGNTARDFRKAWKHVVDLFRFHGADNVIWVWSPNEDSGGSFQFAPLYPGDEWVDWVALDGFNFGGDEGWPSFTTVFGSTYDRLVALTDRPVMIAETGSSEDGGDKAAWITSALGREAPRFPRVRALVLFDGETPRGDFRVDTSPEALRALRRELDSPTYAGTRQTLLSTPASLPGGAGAPTPPDGGYGAPSLWEELKLKLHGKYLVAAAAALLLGLAVLALLVWAARRRGSRRRRPAPAR